MANRLAVFAASLLFTVALPALPQHALPNQTDLHAAYCRKVLSILVSESEASLSFFSGPEYSTVPGPNDPPYLRESKAKAAESHRQMQITLDSQKAMLQKIELYLKPRVLDLDIVPIVAAERSAQEDWNRVGKVTVSCTKNECPINSTDPAKLNDCVSACQARNMPELPTLQKKAKSCMALDWLPF